MFVQVFTFDKTGKNPRILAPPTFQPLHPSRESFVAREYWSNASSSRRRCCWSTWWIIQVVITMEIVSPLRIGVVGPFPNGFFMPFINGGLLSTYWDDPWSSRRGRFVVVWWEVVFFWIFWWWKFMQQKGPIWYDNWNKPYLTSVASMNLLATVGGLANIEGWNIL